MTAPQLRLALDQNFPTPIISAVRPYLPPEIELTHVHKLDSRLSDLTDRVVAVEGLGHDPLRAVGALLLELTGLLERLVPNRSNVFYLSYRRRKPTDA